MAIAFKGKKLQKGDSLFLALSLEEKIVQLKVVSVGKSRLSYQREDLCGLQHIMTLRLFVDKTDSCDQAFFWEKEEAEAWLHDAKEHRKKFYRERIEESLVRLSEVVERSDLDKETNEETLRSVWEFLTIVIHRYGAVKTK